MAQSPSGSPGLLSAGALAAGRYGEDRSFARDLNLDQILAAIAGEREERDLITRVLFAPLHDAGAVAALPASPAAERAFRRLRRMIGEAGGSAQVLRAEVIEGGADLAAAFNKAREQDTPRSSPGAARSWPGSRR